MSDKELQQVEPAMSESAALMQVISRAATDPAYDIDKMERLFKMHEAIVARNAEQAFNAAMAEVQSKSRRVAADSENKQTHSEYASYAALDRALRPIYTEAGFSLSFGTGETTQPDVVLVVCTVSHKAGHSRTYQIPMPADGKGAKGGDVMTKTHATGSATSYGMRYLLKMIFNIATGEDDDGNGADIIRVTENQAADIQALAEEVGADVPALLEYLANKGKVGIKTVNEIPANMLNDAVAALNNYRKRANK